MALWWDEREEKQAAAVGGEERRAAAARPNRSKYDWNRRSMDIQATRSEWAAGGERESAERHRGTMEARGKSARDGTRDGEEIRGIGRRIRRGSARQRLK